MIRIRKSTIHDIDVIIDIYDAARRFMRANGNHKQWCNGYPTRDIIIADIESGNSYVGENNIGEIFMTFAFILGDDPTYNIIEDGEWLNTNPYGTIHRLGSNGHTPGALNACIDFCFSKIDNIRVDTHNDNIPMQAGLARLNFKRCGIIYCDDCTPRIAYQKRICNDQLQPPTTLNEQNAS